MPDLVTANRDSYTVSVLLGQLDQRFLPAKGSPLVVGLPGARQIIVADLNRDKRPDLVAETANVVSVWFAQANGTFPQVPVTYRVDDASPEAGDLIRFSVFELAVGDLNRDGLPDFASAGSGGVAISIQGRQ